MPLQVSVGMSQKIGQPNYGSLGASCQVVMELDSRLLPHDVAAFQEQVREVFDACRQAVQCELARKPAAVSVASGELERNMLPIPPAGNHGERPRPATGNQVRALHAIARQQQFELEEILRERFECVAPEELTVVQASKLIDDLKQWPLNQESAG